MGVSKVIYDGRTLVDLTEDTVKPETLLKGFTAHDKTGQAIEGTLEVPEYIKLDYIESTGTQYIDTDFTPNQDTRVDVKYITTQTSSACIAGVDDGWVTDAFAIFANVAEYGSRSIAGTLYGSSAITASLNKNVLSKNGSTLGSRTYTEFEAPDTLTLFGLNRWGGVVELATMKLYSCQIYDNGELIRDFIPCMLLSGEVGLYDKVNEKFYGNVGTGKFSGTLGS